MHSVNRTGENRPHWLIQALGSLAVGATLLTVLAMPACADVNVYVRFGDGRVLYVPRTSSRVYVSQGGRVYNTLPSGYAPDPYIVNNGVPVYYTQTYWHQHKRYWKNDPAYRGHDDHQGNQQNHDDHQNHDNHDNQNHDGDHH